MLDPEPLKRQIGIHALSADLFKEPLPESGSADCPFCGRKRKLSVKLDRQYRCWHPGCAKHGDIFNLLIDAGAASNFSEAIKLLVKKTGGQTIAERPTPTLTRVWQLLQKELLKSADALAFCKSRHLDPADLGYCPPDAFLESSGFGREQLEQAGLLIKKREFLGHRIVFPLQDYSGRISHLQGRSLDSSDPIRWLSTQGQPSVDQYLINTPSLRCATDLPLFLCEGATDTYSLKQLGLPAIGVAGVQVRLASHARFLSDAPLIVAVFDNDRYPLGTPLSGQYKSWSAMIPELVDLQISLPHTGIFCVVPPSRPGLVDVNDWVISGLTVKTLAQSVHSSLMLPDFILANLSTHPHFLKEAVKLLALDDPVYAEKLEMHLSTQSRTDLLRQSLGL